MIKHSNKKGEGRGNHSWANYVRTLIVCEMTKQVCGKRYKTCHHGSDDLLVNLNHSPPP